MGGERGNLWYVSLIYMHVCADACPHVHAWELGEDIRYLVYHSPPRAIQTGCLTEPSPRDPPESDLVPHSTWVSGYGQLLYLVLRTGLHA